MALDLGRREFIARLSGAAVAWPLAARAQQELPVFGFLRNSPPEGSADFAAAFRRGLQDEGFVDGQNVTIAYAWTNGQADRLPVLAVQLARRPLTVLMAGRDDAIKAAKAATTTIPIAFAAGDDPIKLASSLVSITPTALTAANFLSASVLARKRFEFLHVLAPKATEIGFLVTPTEPAATRFNIPPPSATRPPLRSHKAPIFRSFIACSALASRAARIKQLHSPRLATSWDRAVNLRSPQVPRCHLRRILWPPTSHIEYYVAARVFEHGAPTLSARTGFASWTMPFK